MSAAEHQRRIGHVVDEFGRRGLDALYLTSPVSIYYLTGFSFIATERPVAVVVRRDGGVAFLGPVIEQEHVARKTRVIDAVRTYADYPGETHPIDLFAHFLREMGYAGKQLGIDNPAGAAAMWGYQGPKLTERLPDVRFEEAKDIVEQLRLVKSAEEIELMRESVRWCAYAHRLLQRYTRPGDWDFAIGMRASLEASLKMRKTLGPEYEPQRWGRPPVGAGFRGQVGEMSAIPHAIATKRAIRVGDVLVTGAGADVGGYSAELERTMIVGRPTVKQRRYFEIMRRAQQAAFAAFRPGASCGDVHRAAYQVLKENGCSAYLRHHTGHGMGLEGHEPPWLDPGDSTVLKPGMVFSCEPGIYLPGYAGFRHSDTVLITADGHEILTEYPRDLESLTVGR